MYYIGIDIGGTKCAVVLGQEERGTLRILEKLVFPTAEYPDPYLVLNQLSKNVEKLITGKKIGGIGVSCGGPLNSRQGIILSPPNLVGWDRIPVTSYFSDRFHLPAWLMNDANACTLAEWKYGAGRGLENMAFLTFGTGLGAGLILNSRLYAGLQDMAGELGHWRMESFGPVGYGKSGSLEGFCSGGGIAQLAKERLLESIQQGKPHPLADRLQAVTAKDVFQLAEKGDPLCLEICGVVARQFGRGLALLIDLLNPQAVVAGSIFTRNYQLLCPLTEKVIQEEALSLSASSCRILPSELGENIGDMAALTVAMGLA